MVGLLDFFFYCVQRAQGNAIQGGCGATIGQPLRCSAESGIHAQGARGGPNAAEFRMHRRPLQSTYRRQMQDVAIEGGRI